MAVPLGPLRALLSQAGHVVARQRALLLSQWCDAEPCQQWALVRGGRQVDRVVTPRLGRRLLLCMGLLLNESRELSPLREQRCPHCEAVPNIEACGSRSG